MSAENHSHLNQLEGHALRGQRFWRGDALMKGSGAIIGLSEDFRLKGGRHFRPKSKRPEVRERNLEIVLCLEADDKRRSLRLRELTERPMQPSPTLN
jgi:hypothetical protein